MSNEGTLGPFDRAILTSVVRLATHNDAVDIHGWKTRQLAYSELNPVSGGIHVVTGSTVNENGELPWSVILKVIRHPGGRTMPNGRPVGPGWGEHPAHHNYWKREALAYQSGTLTDMPPGVSAPRCFGVEERSPTETWLWLEHMAGDSADLWPDATFASVAKALGRFNGAYVAGHAPLPSAPWLCRKFLISWGETFQVGLDDLRKPLSHADSILTRLCPPDVAARLFRLRDDREALYERLSSHPQTFCHLDAIPANVITRGEEDVVAVDWAFAGIAAVGEEIVQLLIPALLMPGGRTVAEVERLQERVLTSYIEGLEEVGAKCDESEVRFAYSIAAALRWAFVPSSFGDRSEGDPELRAALEHLLSRPYDRAVEHLAEVQDFLLDLADTARAAL